MHIERRHEWTADITEAMEIQRRFAGEISRFGNITDAHLIAGVDIAVDRASGMGTAAVVIVNYPALNIIEVQTVTGRVPFPYVPGLLSFREIPLIIPAFKKVKNTPDIVIVDGHGIAHPRRIGLASHLGLFLNVPTIGCARSRLVGQYKEPGMTPGSWSVLIDNTDVIGAVLRTKANVKPVYISPGHMIDLKSSNDWVMACCRGYRMPEPIRLAHQAAGGNLGVKSKTYLKDKK
jgi:deoxyribonuclease V